MNALGRALDEVETAGAEGAQAARHAHVETELGVDAELGLAAVEPRVGFEERGVGTGVVIVDNGTILTNLHVVAGALAWEEARFRETPAYAAWWATRLCDWTEVWLRQLWQFVRDVWGTGVAGKAAVTADKVVEAVDALVARHGLPRLEAWLALHRLMQFGLVEHVTQARPFIDGDYYYRFRLPDTSQRT